MAKKTAKSGKAAKDKNSKAKSAAKAAPKAKAPKKAAPKKAAPKGVTVKKAKPAKAAKKPAAPKKPVKKAVLKKAAAPALKKAAKAPKAAPTPKAPKGGVVSAVKGVVAAIKDAVTPAPKAKAKGKRSPEEEEPLAPELEADEGDEEEDDSEAEVVLTDAEGRRYCRVKDCDQVSTVDGYCRYHYLLFWKKIQVRKKILTEGKLERYIEDLTARYPDKFLEVLRKDLRSEKEFLAAIQELEIDESAVDNEFEDEAQTYIDEVRGMAESGGGSREEEDF